MLALPLPSPNPPQPITKAPKLPQVTGTAKEAKPEKVKPKITGAPKKGSVKPKKAGSTGAKPLTTPKPMANQQSTSPIEEISHLLDSLPLQACVQLTRRLLTSISSLPKGEACSRAFLKTVIHFVAEYGRTP